MAYPSVVPPGFFDVIPCEILCDTKAGLLNESSLIVLFKEFDFWEGMEGFSAWALFRNTAAATTVVIRTSTAFFSTVFIAAFKRSLVDLLGQSNWFKKSGVFAF